MLMTTENIKLLINNNFDIAMKAALWDNVELLEDLLQEEVHLIDCLDSWGRAPIHAAAITNDSKCLQLLVNAGANVDLKCGIRGESKVSLYITIKFHNNSNCPFCYRLHCI